MHCYDYVLRYENMENVLLYVCKRAGIVMNVSITCS